MSDPCTSQQPAHAHEGITRRQSLLAGVSATFLFASTRAEAAVPIAEFAQSQSLEPVTTFTVIPPSSLSSLPASNRQLYQLNKRIQQQNRVPEQFPVFVREGFNVIAIVEDYTVTPDGLAYKDFREGSGRYPEEGQQVEFNYVGYNESGSLIDSSYRQDRPAQTRIGIGGLIPGFEMAIRTMKAGGRRRVIVPPALGPPTGPSTFFSAKQCEVFDIELISIQTCSRQQVMMFSKVVCE